MISGSVVLYHGPGSEGEARKQSHLHGLVVPFGTGEALKKDDVRDLVSLLNQTPVGSKPWGVVVGPLDEISPSVGDVLLKTVEEFNPMCIRPFLWARDLGGVLPTLRSRCLHEFVAGEDSRVSVSRPQADKLLKAYTQKNWTDIVSELKESKGDEEFVLLALVEAVQERLLAGRDTGEMLVLWRSLRSFFETREAPSTPARVLNIFLEGSFP